MDVPSSIFLVNGFFGMYIAMDFAWTLKAGGGLLG